MRRQFLLWHMKLALQLLHRVSCFFSLKHWDTVFSLTASLVYADLVEGLVQLYRLFLFFVSHCPKGLCHLTLSSAPVTVRSLQDLSRIYIRRTLRNLTNEDSQGKGMVQRVPQKRKRRRCRRRRINTYVFVGNQLIPQMGESEEEEHPEEAHTEVVVEEEEKDIGDIEILKQVNMLRDQIMALPLPESLKAYLLYYREKWLIHTIPTLHGCSACWNAFLHLSQCKCSIISIKSWWQNCNRKRRHRYYWIIMLWLSWIVSFCWHFLLICISKKNKPM